VQEVATKHHGVNGSPNSMDPSGRQEHGFTSLHDTSTNRTHRHPNLTTYTVNCSTYLLNKKLTQDYKHLTDYNSYNLHVNAIKSAICMLEN